MKARSETGRIARARLLLAPLLVLASLPALAQMGPVTTQSLFFDQAATSGRGNYADLTAGAIYTDNVYLVPDGPGAPLALVGLLADTSREGPRLDWRLDSNIALVKYLKSQYSTQLFGYLDGEAHLKIVPGLFSWYARNSFQQVAITPYAPLTPDNLESVNYLTTGPRFTLQPTLRTTVTLDGIYSYMSTSSQSPSYVNLDNHRYGGDLNISRAFTSTTSAYLSGAYNKVEFKDTTLNDNFTQAVAFAGLSFQDARTVANLSAGYGKVRVTKLVTQQSVIGVIEHTEEQAPSGVMWDASLSRLISPTQRVTLRANQQITDLPNLFQLNYDQAVPSTVPIQIANAEPFTQRIYGASWRFEENRTALQFDLYDARYTYEKTPKNNRTSRAVSGLFARRLSPVLSWDIGASYWHDAFETSTLKTFNFLTSLRWQVGQRVSARFFYAHTTTSPNGYKENQIGIIAGYALQHVPTTGEAYGLRPVAPASSLQPTYLPSTVPPPQ